MLPFGGQGSNQAIEDAGALRYLFNNTEASECVTRNLELFDKVRRLRASRAQILSRVRTGKEQEVREELLQYADPPGSCKCFPPFYLWEDPDWTTAVPESFAERTVHDYGWLFRSTPKVFWLITFKIWCFWEMCSSAGAKSIATRTSVIEGVVFVQRLCRLKPPSFEAMIVALTGSAVAVATISNHMHGVRNFAEGQSAVKALGCSMKEACQTLSTWLFLSSNCQTSCFYLSLLTDSRTLSMHLSRTKSLTKTMKGALSSVALEDRLQGELGQCAQNLWHLAKGST